MRWFTTIVAAVMSSAHLASRIFSDMDRGTLEAKAKKGPPGTGLLGWDRFSMRDPLESMHPQLASPKRQLDSHSVTDRLSTGNVAARGVGRLAAGGASFAFGWQISSRLFAGKSQWQPHTEGTSQTSNAIAAKGELDLAKGELEKALAASGAYEKHLCAECAAALTAVQEAMEDTREWLNGAQPGFDTPQLAINLTQLPTAAVIALKAVEVAMDKCQAMFTKLERAHDAAQSARGRPRRLLVLLSLLSSLRGFHLPAAVTALEVHHAHQARAAISAATETWQKAMSIWWYDVQRMDTEGKQDAAEADMASAEET